MAADAFAPEQVLRIGNSSEPKTLDPQVSVSSQDHHVERDLYEGLVVLDGKGRLVPGQAESWTVSPDGRTYRFTLRAGLTWSDGTPLTAEDFVYSWRRAVTPATGSTYTFFFFPIENAAAIAHGEMKDATQLGVRALDARTLEVTLSAPIVYFLSMISDLRFLPVNRAAIEKYGAAFIQPGHLVSNGAFVLAEWSPESRIRLVKNPRYWNAAAVKLTEVDYLPIERQNEELTRYTIGDLDVTNGMATDQLELIRRSIPNDIRLTPHFGTYYLGFNLTKPPFKDNQKLREALALVIDREAIVENITRAGEQPAYSWVPPGMPGYEPQTVTWKNWSMADRIARARELYREAGYGPENPLSVELRYNTSENHKRIMTAIAAMMTNALGVRPTLINEEYRTFLDNRQARKITEIYRAAWGADYPDASSFLDVLQSDGKNDMGYANPAYDTLVKKAAQTPDQTARSALLAQAERIAMVDLPLVPVFYDVSRRLVRPYVRGFDINQLGYFYSKDAWIAAH